MKVCRESTHNRDLFFLGAFCNEVSVKGAIRSPPKLTRNEATSLTYDGSQEFRRFAGQRHPVSLHWMVKVTGNTTERTAKADEETEATDDEVETYIEAQISSSSFNNS